MVLVKNDQYWGADDVKLEKINYKVIQESNTAVQSYINGELDVIATSDPNWAKTIEEQGGSQSYTVPNSSPQFYMLNAANEYLSNEKIRQALTVAYDRQQMVDDLRNGKGSPIYSLMLDQVMVGDKSYTELVDGKNYLVKELQDEIKDPKALLIEGLKELGKDPDPSKVTIRYASRGTTEVSKKIAEWMKQTWEETLGINVEINMMEWNIMWDKIDEGDYDIATAGWGPYYNEPSALLQLFDPDNGYFNSKKTGWTDDSSKEFQNLLNEAKYEVDDQKKADIYLQAETLLVKTALIEPTYVEKSPTFVKDYVAPVAVGALTGGFGTLLYEIGNATYDVHEIYDEIKNQEVEPELQLLSVCTESISSNIEDTVLSRYEQQILQAIDRSNKVLFDLIEMAL